MMKNRLNLLTILGALALSVCAHAVTLNLMPATASVDVGDPFEVELRISGLGTGTAPSLGAYDFTLAYNPVVLDFSAFTFGDGILGNQLDLMGFGTVSGLASGTAGQLSAFEISLDLTSDLDALQSTSFALGTISFNTLGNGASAMEFTSAVLSDARGNPLAVQLGSSSIQVPEPVSGGLIIAASIAFALAVQHVKRNPPGSDLR